MCATPETFCSGVALIGMTPAAPTTDIRWIFRAGVKGGFTEVERLENEITFSFRDLSDLALLPDSRGAFRVVVAAGYPELRASQLPLRISQIYWFVHRVAPGDKILYVDEILETAHEGTVAGHYQYLPAEGPYFNQRAVQWAEPRSFRETPAGLLELWRGHTGIVPVGGLGRFDTPLAGSALLSSLTCGLAT